MQTSHVTAISSSSSSSLSLSPSLSLSLKMISYILFAVPLLCISEYVCLFFHVFHFGIMYCTCFRVTWGICTLICIQGRGNIQVLLILQSKGAAGFLKQSTNFLYVKIDNDSSSQVLLHVMFFVYIQSILNYQFTSTCPRCYCQ